MADIDYTHLSRLQKLAVFLIVIGPEAAAEVLKQFEDSEVELLCREMGQFTLISDTVRTQALDEFAPIVGAGLLSTLGGLEFARRALEIARGEYKAATLLNRVGASAAASTVDVIADIAGMEGRQIYNLIKQEQPQTVAFVLSYLDAPKAAEVFSLLDADRREEILERLGTIDSTSLGLVAKVVRNLSRHFDRKVAPAFHHSGGVRAVADLLNGIDKDAAKALLTRIEERNNQLGGAIRRKMFSFEDIRRLSAMDLQRVLREVDSAQLAIAMKSATEALRDKIYSSLSKRAAEGLRDEISMLGPVRLRDVETAQDAIIQTIRLMEEEGTISLDGGEIAMVT
ncbi:flagellar motor switch protein FliG [Opitutaceae bacterium TAV4]|uniref:flagellar motor switch protein FliG n=1 Tax=Geminisphaera colitermitum TaxID=1148786 RepID=UPI000158D098|nr:flagellar motor switch protein FliG [Geminisphaera colitermitum]RRJ98034.1 flagellar motor switch protein FliG [Opitutaceae bacterium TAV4]RRK02569.1 flagellar motor switch protein FliG [Opitutaceae bacterium TAV3]